MEIKLVTDRKSLIFAAPEPEEVSKALEQAKLTTKQIYEWGNEECPHVHKVFTTRPKRVCDICWEELAKP